MSMSTRHRIKARLRIHPLRRRSDARSPSRVPSGTIRPEPQDYLSSDRGDAVWDDHSVYLSLPYVPLCLALSFVETVQHSDAFRFASVRGSGQTIAIVILCIFR